MKDIFERFIEYKKSTGRKERLYVSVLKTFDNYCCSLPSFATTLDKEIVDGFLQITDQRRLSSALKDASVLRELGRYMHRIGIKDAYVTGLHGSKKSTYMPYIFSREQIILILQEAFDFHFCYDSINPNMKNVISCLYTVLYCTGMRISEALSLKLTDVSLVEHTVLVMESKNGRQRLLPISESLSLKCEKYLSIRCS
ncbi:MAG TPA: tyrosine-type recombinase/integrase, partial [Bacteroidales bacterium]|nr:tyrosine-type recombinase/integrase [Bacteroidales bacterium]